MATKNNVIIRYTTPTIKFVFNTLDVGEIEDARLVIKQQRKAVITLDFAKATIGEGFVSWVLAQEDTAKLKEFESAEVYCDWKTVSGTRGRSKMTICTVEPAGYEDII